ncbi:hypothetical protein MKZ38_007766 [Zalerion maritima]|uniref:Uncharacterized protein n=1 Tax=Zalerion maritima TaxID=339359 RepID=A0AAD5WVE4_9PEZI|nr:hypothetical protein MKZ38_007766 [Zalerion maritima]
MRKGTRYHETSSISKPARCGFASRRPLAVVAWTSLRIWHLHWLKNKPIQFISTLPPPVLQLTNPTRQKRTIFGGHTTGPPTTKVYIETVVITITPGTEGSGHEDSTSKPPPSEVTPRNSSKQSASASTSPGATSTRNDTSSGVESSNQDSPTKSQATSSDSLPTSGMIVAEVTIDGIVTTIHVSASSAWPPLLTTVVGTGFSATTLTIPAVTPTPNVPTLVTTGTNTFTLDVPLVGSGGTSFNATVTQHDGEEHTFTLPPAIAITGTPCSTTVAANGTTRTESQPTPAINTYQGSCGSNTALRDPKLIDPDIWNYEGEDGDDEPSDVGEPMSVPTIMVKIDGEDYYIPHPKEDPDARSSIKFWPRKIKGVEKSKDCKPLDLCCIMGKVIKELSKILKDFSQVASVATGALDAREIVMHNLSKDGKKIMDFANKASEIMESVPESFSMGSKLDKTLPPIADNIVDAVQRSVKFKKWEQAVRNCINTPKTLGSELFSDPVSMSKWILAMAVEYRAELSALVAGSIAFFAALQQTYVRFLVAIKAAEATGLRTITLTGTETEQGLKEKRPFYFCFKGDTPDDVFKTIIYQIDSAQGVISDDD